MQNLSEPIPHLPALGRIPIEDRRIVVDPRQIDDGEVPLRMMLGDGFLFSRRELCLLVYPI